jgi:hypothetical protein
MTYSGSPGQWVAWDVTAHAQDALASVGSVLYLIENYTTSSPNIQAAWHSPYYLADTSLRPKLTITYVAPSAVTFNRSRIVNLGVTGPQNRSTIANA